LENLDDVVDIYRAWETIRENITISGKESLGYHELKKISDGSTEYVRKYQRKQTKLQWLQDRNQTSGDNLKNITREANRHFWNKKRQR
jgi:hypothetical protein